MVDVLSKSHIAKCILNTKKLQVSNCNGFMMFKNDVAPKLLQNLNKTKAVAPNNGSQLGVKY